MALIAPRIWWKQGFALHENSVEMTTNVVNLIFAMR